MAGKYTPSSPTVLKIMDGLTMAEAFARVSSRDSRILAVRQELRAQERTVLDFTGKKNESKDSSVALSYRPIALTSYLCTLFEKMVNVRLVYFHEQGLFLSPSQSSFRKHRSTTDALVRLEAAACEAFA
ncbi:hypothetical protein Pcinc_010711 [Petrolisthes cinctipes]|uniref:Reverse transcriptase domain-containing protein n=1 Tax=Petrolisthes cinctipes TaxID=88211 RepID=A0AAE1G2J7_PETCI|nr:hypothetical protein Pcinc_010711 [Petrolisthes cinctipes]